MAGVETAAGAAEADEAEVDKGTVIEGRIRLCPLAPRLPHLDPDGIITMAEGAAEGVLVVLEDVTPETPELKRGEDINVGSSRFKRPSLCFSPVL